MTIRTLSNEMLIFCKSDEIPYKENKRKMINLFHDLRDFKITNEEEIKTLISLHRALSKIKNRKASYLEEEIARLILVGLPSRIIWNDEEIPEDAEEELKEEYKNESRLAIKLSSELLKYAKEIIASKPDKSKRYQKRIKEAIRLLDRLQLYYYIEGIKDIFISKIESKDEDVQFFALDGLSNYYASESADELTDEQEIKLEEIINSTNRREIASTCCQILIETGKMDEFEAMMEIDDWKEINW